MHDDIPGFPAQATAIIVVITACGKKNLYRNIKIHHVCYLDNGRMRFNYFVFYT